MSKISVKNSENGKNFIHFLGEKNFEEKKEKAQFLVHKFFCAPHLHELHVPHYIFSHRNSINV
jgi:hypothetical protein